MMRTIFLAVFAIFLGIALGIGVALLRIKAAPWRMDAEDRAEAATDSTSFAPLHHTPTLRWRRLASQRLFLAQMVENPLRDGEVPPAPIQQTKPPAAKPPSKLTTGKDSEAPYDPIKENGHIFVEWPKPKLALVITGMEDGYIEPCGCAGLDRMKGGMGRRYSFLQEYRKKGWPLLVLDVGGIAKGFGRQAELKFQTLVEGKVKMGYDAIAFGTNELKLPAGELVSVAAGVNGCPGIFMAANVGLLGKPGEIAPTHRIIDAGGMKVGVTAVLGSEYQKEINNPEVEMTDPAAALEHIVPELKKADYRILLAHATLAESIALAKRFPEFNVVVTSSGPEMPPPQAQRVRGTQTLVLSVGHKGMAVVVLGLFDDPSVPFRYQRVPLDSRFPIAPEMKMLMAAYQDQLKAIGFEGLGLRPVPHPMSEIGGRFVGSAKCESCHEESYEVWKKSRHAHAYETLATLDPPRNHDPECLSCHVVGWHPTSYFPYVGGYESKEKTPKLINTGCENCHGPGEKHCAAELGNNEKIQEKYRKACVVTKEESMKRQCATCHDLDNSPDFDFETYYPDIEHKEEE